MRLTTARWSAMFATIASALVVTSLLLADRATDDYSLDGLKFEHPIHVLRVRARSQAMIHAARVHTDASTLERWRLERERDPSATLVLDRALPDSIAARYAALLTPFVDSLRADTAASRVAIFIHRDSSSAEEWTKDTLRGRGRGAASMERIVLPPNVSGDGRCVTIISIGLESPVPKVLHNPLGPCALVARFGRPGGQMALLLDTLGWRPPVAFSNTYSASTATREMRRDARTYLEAYVALRCLSRGESCEDIWRTAYVGRQSYWARTSEGNPCVIRTLYAPTPLMDLETESMERFISQLQRDLGDKNFRAVWRGDVVLDDALARQAGMTRSQWTRGWLAASFDVVPTSPLPSGSECVWALAVIGAFVALGARGRAPRAR